MLKIPRMHGSWSIWLISTIFGFSVVKNYDLVLILTILLFLFSVEPVYSYIMEKRIDKSMIVPVIFIFLLLFLFIKNPRIVRFVLPYSFLFSIQLALKNNMAVFTGVGSIIMTLPFPLITSYFSIGVEEILKALIFLILLVIYSFALVLYRNKGKPLLAVTFFILLNLYTFTPKQAYFMFILLTSLLFIIVKRVSLKGVGKILLTYQFISIFIYQFLFL